MFSQRTLTSRRQFLERSMLGFGSAFLLPSLLTSCNDHLIDPTKPGNPTNPPLDDPTDLTDTLDKAAKAIVIKGLQSIPEVGTFVGDLVDLLWTGPDSSPFDQVKSQVEALVEKDLDNTIYQVAVKQLGAMAADIKQFKTYVTNKENISSNFDNVLTNFNAFQATVSVSTYEVLLLPLYAQFANMYLAFIRDALLPSKQDPNVLNGTAWGITDDQLVAYFEQCTAKITEFTNWVNEWYASGRLPFSTKGSDPFNLEPFQSTNAYDRFMTMSVLDYMDSWKYYNPSLYGLGSKVPPLFTREIYSDPHGTLQGDGTTLSIVLPTPATQFPTGLNVWSGTRLDAVRLTYPAGGGPNGVTTTPRMGDSNGGSPHNFDLFLGNPITQAQINVLVDNHAEELAVNTLQLTFNDGTATGMMGTLDQYQFYRPYTISYPGYALSSIYIQGTTIAAPDSSVNCIVFGFKRWPQ